MSDLSENDVSRRRQTRVEGVDGVSSDSPRSVSTLEANYIEQDGILEQMRKTYPSAMRELDALGFIDVVNVDTLHRVVSQSNGNLSHILDWLEARQRQHRRFPRTRTWSANQIRMHDSAPGYFARPGRFRRRMSNSSSVSNMSGGSEKSRSPPQAGIGIEYESRRSKSHYERSRTKSYSVSSFSDDNRYRGESFSSVRSNSVMSSDVHQRKLRPSANQQEIHRRSSRSPEPQTEQLPRSLHPSRPNVRATEELFEFLKKHKLEDYTGILFEEGYDSVASLRCATKGDLESIGVKKGHALRMMTEVKKLPRETSPLGDLDVDKLREELGLIKSADDIRMEEALRMEQLEGRKQRTEMEEANMDLLAGLPPLKPNLEAIPSSTQL